MEDKAIRKAYKYDEVSGIRRSGTTKIKPHYDNIVLTQTKKKPVASQPIPLAQSNPLMLDAPSSYKPIVKKAMKIR